MKRMLKRYLSLVALFSVAIFSSSANANYFRIRSQSFDSANWLVGITNQINLFDMGGFYGTFNFKYEYNRNFRGQNITQCMFGNALVGTGNDLLNGSSSNFIGSNGNFNCNTGCNTDCNDCCNGRLLIQGSCAVDRNAKALLADYFGLPTDFKSEISFCPRIEQHIFDFSFYAGLDEWLCGLWFMAHAPIVHAKWDLNARENVTTPGVAAYPAGYFAPAAVPRSSLLNSFCEYQSGLTPTLNGGVTFDALNQCQFKCSSGNNCNTNCETNCSSNCKSETKLSDIHLGLGWNFWQDEDYHVGLGVLFVAPTGTRADNSCLFKPQIGNGHHFELGGILTAHYTLWRGCDWDQHFSFHVWAQVTHMFKECQVRCFDLCNTDCNVNGLSRYMLAQQLGPVTPAGTLLGNPTPLDSDTIGGVIPETGFTASNLQFANRFVPLANLLSRRVEVSVPVQGDITLLFNYTSCNFSWDFGYKFYGRSCEDFDCKPTFFTNTNIAANATLALKGDAYVFGFPREDGSLVTTTTPPVALAATQSTACITGGNNFADGCGADAAAFAQLQRNPGIDNPQFAYTTIGGLNVPLLAQPIAAPGVPEGSPSTQTRTSIQPVLLSDQAAAGVNGTRVDVNGQRTKDRTHTIFTHLSYEWNDWDCWVPYLGVGAKVEFAGNNCDNNNCGSLNSCSTNGCLTNGCSTNGCFDDCNDNCKRCGLTQWGVWIKGGVSFN